MLYPRGNVWRFSFRWNGEHIPKTTKIKVGSTKNGKAAQDAEAAYRVALAKGEVGIIERAAAPTMKEFSQRFIDTIQARCAAKPKTVEFYVQQLTRALEFEPLANARRGLGMGGHLSGTCEGRGIRLSACPGREVALCPAQCASEPAECGRCSKGARPRPIRNGSSRKVAHVRCWVAHLTISIRNCEKP